MNQPHRAARTTRAALLALSCLSFITYAGCTGSYPEGMERTDTASNALEPQSAAASLPSGAPIPTPQAGAAAPAAPQEPSAAVPQAEVPSAPVASHFDVLPPEDGWSSETSGMCTLCNSTPPAGGILRSDDPRKARITNVSFRGDLCGRPAERCLADRDGTTTIIFSTHIDGTEHQGGSCSIAFDLDVLEGYQMATPTVVIKGAGGLATFVRSYEFEDVQRSQPFTTKLSNRDFNIATDRPTLWSPTCSGSSHTRFVANLDVSMVPLTSAFAITSFDLATHFVAGVRWRTCGQEESPEPPAPIDVSSCPDDNPPVITRCGGPHHLACADGKICWYYDGVPVDESVEGSCEEPIAAIDQPCPKTGWPARECEAGSQCWPHTKTCKEATGTSNSPCGEDMTPCIEPLVCLPGYDTCRPPPEQCEPGTCPKSLFCNPATRVCVSADGKARSLCGGELPECESDLICELGRCRTPQSISDQLTAAVAAAADAAAAAAIAADEAAGAAASAAKAAEVAQTPAAQAAAAEAAQAAAEAAEAARAAADLAAIAAADETMALMAASQAEDERDRALDAAEQAQIAATAAQAAAESFDE